MRKYFTGNTVKIPGSIRLQCIMRVLSVVLQCTWRGKCNIISFKGRKGRERVILNTKQGGSWTVTGTGRAFGSRG